MTDSVPDRYRTAAGVQVERRARTLSATSATEPLIDALDHRLGMLTASEYEYPGRYVRAAVGFVDPPLRLWSRARAVWVDALNPRGRVLLGVIRAALDGLPAVEAMDATEDSLAVRIRAPGRRFPEEQRSKQVSVFSLLRAIVSAFAGPDDPFLGLYGVFGYDLAFQFEPITYCQHRPCEQRDLVLYLPDRVLVVDPPRDAAVQYDYEFTIDGVTTAGLERGGDSDPYRPAAAVAQRRDQAPGEFAALVREAHEWFRRGDLFEVVAGQSFFEPCRQPPSTVYRRLRERNPAPYAILMNLGEREYLVGASPEMYLRVSGRRIETGPISGTIARGDDALGDAEQILTLLNSDKEAAELTMCTDVDRNDKSRVCEPGSVRVIGRRQIELYSRLIHTVDHVEGTLRPPFDGLDAFLSHAWAVTVTGAPKLWAMRFIEQHERSHRAWYGGAFGRVGFDGDIDTGLTLRTIRIKDGVAEIRAGGTLLIDADPDSEERETELKAAAFIDAVLGDAPASTAPTVRERVGTGRRVLLIDHEDSFVHTLADYFRQTGAEVSTLRADPDRGERERMLREIGPDLLVLSPGPGTPATFDLSTTIELARAAQVPVFGVCLGLQGIVEHFGGALGVLPYPVHGKASEIHVRGGRLFEGLPTRFRAGRYHSLYARREAVPEAELIITAETEDQLVMAVEHRRLPIAAVQFHPESILSAREAVGLGLIDNAVRILATRRG
ncbi:anthranilate synthase component I [Haliangium sp.]|uniref:anthranilate synthase component I n=1 Tax=Haliangium sp. TaxID=2663208 RepID=UPI003D0CB3A3